MLASEKKESKKKLLAAFAIICVLIIFAVYYVEYREINDAYSLAGRVLYVSNDVSSYQFDIHSNISILGETLPIIMGNGSVDYKNERIASKFKSAEESIDLIVVDDYAYFRSNNGPWEKEYLNEQMWDSYDQLSQKNILLDNTTNLSMQKMNSHIVMTAIPDRCVLIQEAKKVGLDLQGDEQLNDYYIKYLIDKDTYRVISIETHIEFLVNIQGLVSPVIINNQVDIYNYNEELDIETPI